MRTQGHHSELPFDILLELVSKQSLPELLSSRLLGSQWRTAADYALFSRQDEQAIEHQERLLQLWSNKTPAEMSALFSEGHGLFKRNLLASIQSPVSNPYYRLSGLRVLGAMNHCPVSISPAVIDGLLNKLNHEDWTARQIALKALPPLATLMSEAQIEALITQVVRQFRLDSSSRKFAVQICSSVVSLMTEKQRTELISLATGYLYNSDWVARIDALKLLSVISSFMTEDEHAIFTASVTGKVYDEDQSIRKSALKILLANISRMTEQQIATLITRATSNLLYDSDENARAAALECCLAIINKKSGDQLATLITEVVKKSNSPTRAVRAAALKALSSIASIMNEDERAKLISRVSGKLHDLDKDVRAAALEAYLALINRKDSTQVATFATQVIKIVNGKSWGECETLLKALTSIASLMTDDELAIIITQASGKLDDLDANVHATALKALSSIASLMNEDQRTALITQITKKLNDKKWDTRTREEALIAFSSIASHIDEAQLAAFFIRVSEKLEDGNWRVEKAALDAFLSIVSLMTKEQHAALFTLAAKKLLSESTPNVSAAALEVCLATINKKDPAQVATFVTQITETINGESWLNCTALLKTLTAIASLLTEEQRLALITLVAAKLDNTFTIVGVAALEAYLAILNKRNAAQVATFIIQITGEQSKSNVDFRKAALKALSIIANDVCDEPIIQKITDIANVALNDPYDRVREQAFNLASTLVVLGKYRNTNVEQQAEPSVESLVLEGLRQMYSRDALYGKLEPGEQLSTNKAANAAVLADEQHAGTVQSESMPHAGHNRLLNGIGFFGVETMQTNDPEIALNAPTV